MSLITKKFFTLSGVSLMKDVCFKLFTCKNKERLGVMKILGGPEILNSQFSGQGSPGKIMKFKFLSPWI